MGLRVGKIHQQRKEKGTKVVYRDLLKDSEYGYICFSKRKKWDTKKYFNQYKYQNFLIDNEHFEMETVKNIRLVGKEPTLDLRVEDEHNFIADGIVVHNTGIQRSGGTPHAAWTTTSPSGKISVGKSEWKKPIVDIVAAHRIPYAATASVGYPMDFVAKAKKALEKQPSFIVVHCCCPPGWKIDNSKGPKIAKLAVDTGINPLYEIENGQLRLTKPVSNRKPVSEYLKFQGRFKHLDEKEIRNIQQHTDKKCEELEAREKCGLKFFY
jgi:hypothetical protein